MHQSTDWRPDWRWKALKQTRYEGWSGHYNSSCYGLHVSCKDVTARFTSSCRVIFAKTISVAELLKEGITGWAATWHSANHLITYFTPATDTCLSFGTGHVLCFLWSALLLPCLDLQHPSCSFTERFPVIKNLQLSLQPSKDTRSNCLLDYIHTFFRYLW